MYLTRAIRPFRSAQAQGSKCTLWFWSDHAAYQIYQLEIIFQATRFLQFGAEFSNGQMWCDHKSFVQSSGFRITGLLGTSEQIVGSLGFWSPFNRQQSSTPPSTGSGCQLLWDLQSEPGFTTVAS